MAAQKREFTLKDLQDAFQQGAYIALNKVVPLNRMAFERWMRTSYPQRYVRKPKKKAA